MKRSTTLYLALPWLALSPLVVPAQALVNGGFEESLSNTCAFNLFNEEFNEVMTGVTSFGNTPHDGGFGEADILVNGCLAGPRTGERAVMIACEATTTDRLALALTEPLQAGTTYRFGLHAMAWTQWNPVVHAIEVGVSNSPTSFGTPVGMVMPESMEWNLLEVDITPAQSVAYITLRVVLDGDNGAVIIDDLVVESTASIADAAFASTPFLRSTVLVDALPYIGTEAGELSVMDPAGRTLRTFRVAGPAELNVADLPAGGYLVLFTRNGQRRMQRVVKP